jgi:hypothetical protein
MELNEIETNNSLKGHLHSVLAKTRSPAPIELALHKTSKSFQNITYLADPKGLVTTTTGVRGKLIADQPQTLRPTPICTL